MLKKICLFFQILITPLMYINAETGFLLIDPVARYNGFAGAASAIVNDPSAMYFNPAGLSNIGNFGLTVNKTSYFSNIDIYYIAATKNLSKFGSLGIALYMFDLGEQVKIDEYANYLGEYRSYYSYISVGYGKCIYKNISAGFSTKVIKSKKYFPGDGLITGNGFTTDFGIQMTNIISNITIQKHFDNIPFSSLSLKSKPKGFSFGAGIYNIGSEFSYSLKDSTVSFEFIKTIRLGVGYQIIQTNLLAFRMSYDYRLQLKHPEYRHQYYDHTFCGEITLINILTVRYGQYILDKWNQNDQSMFGISVGPEKIQFSYSKNKKPGRRKIEYFGLTVLF